MSIRIREAQLTDITAVAKLFDMYRQFYEQPADLDRAEHFLRERLEQRESVILLAEQSTPGLLGFCQLYPSFCSVEARPIYVLYDLFVHPAARQHGVGRLLLQAAEQRAAADGKARMDLTTARSNTTAQALYQSMGWLRDDIYYAYSRRIASQASSPDKP